MRTSATDHFMPAGITVSRDRLAVRLIWEDGEASLTAADLRLSCRCAWCTRDRIIGCFPSGFEDVAIEDIRPVGAQAVNIGFSDGHSRGIYPWPYLHDLSRGGPAPALKATGPLPPLSMAAGTAS